MRLEAETATLADAVARAARVAPTRGAQLLQAGGITFRFLPNPPSTPDLVIEATDLETTYRQSVATIEIDADCALPHHWRIPSHLISSILSTLPMDHGLHVVLEEEDTGAIKITCGRMKAKLNQIDLPPQTIPAFDTADFLAAPEFAQKISQVAWACHSQNQPYSGIRITGDHLIGTDRCAAAVVACKVPVEEPITVPLRTITALIKNAPTVALKATKDRLLIAPDTETQTTSLLYTDPFPDVMKVLRSDFAVESKVNAGLLSTAVQRMMVLVKGEEFPLVKLVFGDKTVRVEMQVPEIGLMEDEVDIDSGPFDPFEVWLTPQYLVGALTNAGADEVLLRYGPRADQHFSVSVSDRYRCDISPRVVSVTGQAAA